MGGDTRRTPRSIDFRIVDPDADAAVLHAWVTHPRSVYWQMQQASLADVRDEYAALAATPGHRARIGLVDGTPSFLAEFYDPRDSELAGVPELGEGDLGMHVLVAPTDPPVPGFTRRVFAAVMRRCFEDPGVRRVVVEPDCRNHKILALNAEAGFEVARHLPLAGKTAALSFCTRAAFDASPLATPPLDPSPSGDTP